MFLSCLIEQVTGSQDDKKNYGLYDENAIIRYYSVEYIVNLILIMRENVFREILAFFEILQQSLSDINEKVRYAALSLNEILKDMIIEYVNSPKLDLGRLVNEFSTTLSKMNVATSRDLILQWILLFEGLPTFNLSDHFM